MKLYMRPETWEAGLLLSFIPKRTAQVFHRLSPILVFALSGSTLELKETEIGVFLWRDCSFKKAKVM